MDSDDDPLRRFTEDVNDSFPVIKQFTKNATDSIERLIRSTAVGLQQLWHVLDSDQCNYQDLQEGINNVAQIVANLEPLLEEKRDAREIATLHYAIVNTVLLSRLIERLQMAGDAEALTTLVNPASSGMSMSARTNEIQVQPVIDEPGPSWSSSTVKITLSPRTGKSKRTVFTSQEARPWPDAPPGHETRNDFLVNTPTDNSTPDKIKHELVGYEEEDFGRETVYQNIPMDSLHAPAHDQILMDSMRDAMITYAPIGPERPPSPERPSKKKKKKSEKERPRKDHSHSGRRHDSPHPQSPPRRRHRPSDEHRSLTPVAVDVSPPRSPRRRSPGRSSLERREQERRTPERHFGGSRKRRYSISPLRRHDDRSPSPHRRPGHRRNEAIAANRRQLEHRRGREDMITCKVCKQFSGNGAQLRFHILHKHPMDYNDFYPFGCMVPVCDFRAYSSHIMHKHQESEHSNEPMLDDVNLRQGSHCPECSEPLDSLMDAVLHCQNACIIKGNEIECGCGLRFASTCKLNNHRRRRPDGCSCFTTRPLIGRDL